MTQKERRQEREANIFALCLLMPRDQFLKEWEKNKIDLADDEPLRNMADKFGVSMTAIMARASMLKLI